MISLPNYRIKLEQNNIIPTNYIMELYNNKIESKILLNLGYNFLDTTNKNKHFFQYDCVESDNVTCLPLGIAVDEKLILNLEPQEKSILCSSQFSFHTRVDQDLSKIQNLPFVTYFPNQHQEKYIENLAKSKYVLSPHGHYPDCYRHWESMYVSAIPITLNHPHLESFKDLPILFLDSWDELSEELLNERYEEIINKPREKLDINYWIDLMKVIR